MIYKKFAKIKINSDQNISQIRSKQPEEISKAFDVCGLVPAGEFEQNVLHPQKKSAFE